MPAAAFKGIQSLHLHVHDNPGYEAYPSFDYIGIYIEYEKPSYSHPCEHMCAVVYCISPTLLC